MGIERIDNIGLAVADLEQAVAFFRDRLGAKTDVAADAEPPSASVYFGDQYLYVFQTTSTQPGAKRDDMASNPPGVDHISFRVTDIDATYRELRDRGVSFDGEPVTDADWGLRMVSFGDGLGNAYFLVEPVEA